VLGSLHSFVFFASFVLRRLFLIQGTHSQLRTSMLRTTCVSGILLFAVYLLTKLVERNHFGGTIV